MFNKHEIARNACQLYGGQSKCGYDWWWHSFTAHHEKTGKEQAFFIEYFLCNPSSGGDKPVFGQLEENKNTAGVIQYTVDENFVSNTKVMEEEEKLFPVGDIDKYTVVIWLEGWDPECVNKILDGEIKMSMGFWCYELDDGDGSSAQQ